MLSWCFASSGIEYYFRKNSLLANCFQVDKTVWFWWMELKGFHFTLKLWQKFEEDQVKKIKKFLIEDQVEINSGRPTPLGSSKSSEPGWAGCKACDGGHHMPWWLTVSTHKTDVNHHQDEDFSERFSVQKFLQGNSNYFGHFVRSCCLCFLILKTNVPI